MIQYGKALKLFKWILQKHREEPATGSGISGETVSHEQQIALSGTDYGKPTRAYMDGHEGDMDHDRDDAAAGYGKGNMDREMIVGKCQKRSVGMGYLDQLKKRMTSNKPSVNGGEGFSFKQFREISCARACMMSLKPNIFVKTPYVPISEEYMALVEGRYREEQQINNADIRRRASNIMGSKKMLGSSKERKQGESWEDQAAAINNSQNSNKASDTQRRNIRTSRMKEIVKWQATSRSSERNNHWKFFNRKKESLSGTSGSEEDLMSSCSSSSMLNRWDIRNCSSSSFSSSGRSSSTASSFRGVQSKWEVQSNALCAAPRGNRDNWITTDSEYVVLEI